MKKKRYLFVIISLALIAVHHFVFAGQAEDIKKVAGELKTLKSHGDILWTSIAAFLVFFMQAGFAMVEAGFTRAKNAANIIMKNLMDFAFGSLAFWIIGASIMFGANESGLFGSIDLGLSTWLGDAANDNRYSYLIFQTVFAATAATIVSGAMAERTKFSSYLIYSIVVTALIYPVFGSWAWNSLWGAEIAVKTMADGKEVIKMVGSAGWLEAIEWLKVPDETGKLVAGVFNDFAGSTVVHSVGAWLGLAGALMLGARRGRYSNGSVKPIPGHSLTMAGLGVFILWLGWFGFNAGSTTSLGVDLSKIAVTTNLAAAAGAVGALLTGWMILKKPDVGTTLNGALAGLVGITAGCASTDPLGASIIGFTSGIIVVISVLFFDKLKIDDPVGAISVHGMAGAWGTLLIGFLAVDSKGSFIWSGSQFLVQLAGVVACFVFAFGAGLILFFILKKTIGLRVSEEEESQGLDLSEHGAEAYADFRISQR